MEKITQKLHNYMDIFEDEVTFLVMFWFFPSKRRSHGKGLFEDFRLYSKREREKCVCESEIVIKSFMQVTKKNDYQRIAQRRDLTGWTYEACVCVFLFSLRFIIIIINFWVSLFFCIHCCCYFSCFFVSLSRKLKDGRRGMIENRMAVVVFFPCFFFSSY